MRSLTILTLAAGLFALGGCSVFQGNRGGYGTPDPLYGIPPLHQVALNACGSRASRYGRVRVTSVQPGNHASARVEGQITLAGGELRMFSCTFHNDGRITGFQLGYPLPRP
jgi:hypothetical protein